MSNSDNQSIDINDLFYLADKYFANKNNMYRHNYDSYEQFIERYIPEFLYNSDNIFNTQITDKFKYVNKLKFSDCTVQLPCDEFNNVILYPSQARLQMMNYTLKINVNIQQIQEVYNTLTEELIETKKIDEDNIVIATIPVMVKSKFCNLIAHPTDEELKKECEYDPGCCFILKGMEKVIVPQETQANNKIRCLEDAESFYAQIISESADVSLNSQSVRISYYKKNKKQNKKGQINIEIPPFFEFPLVILFRVMGIETDKDIIDSICYDPDNNDIKQILINAIRLSEDGEEIRIDTKEKAYDYLISKLRKQPEIKYSSDPEIQKIQKIKYIDYILSLYLPHITTGKLGKINFTAYMTNKLLRTVANQIPTSARDSFTQKRILLVGDLMFEIFKASIKQVLESLKSIYKKKVKNPAEPIKIINLINDSYITKNIHSAVTNGTFNKKTGVTNALERLTYPFLLSLLRRIVAPLNKAVSGATSGPKKLHYSHIGFLCPNETPESEKVGLVKQLSLIGSISINHREQIDIIKKIVKKYIIPINQINSASYYRKLNEFTKIMIEGELYGIIEDTEKVYNLLKTDKYNGTIEKTVSISYDDIEDEINIWCGPGRLIRPVLKVDNHKLNLTKKMINEDREKLKSGKMTTFDEFMYINENIIEFIDPEEQVAAMIAPTTKDVEKEAEKINNIIKDIKKDEYEIANRYNNQIFKDYDYAEIHPSLLLGTIMSTSQFCNHADGTRSNLHYNQSKQSIGIYSSNYRYRYDKAFILHHPQEAIVQTRASKYTNYNRLPPGENVIMAVMSYTGFNQEDAIIMNYDAIKRGLLKITNYNVYSSKLEKNQQTGMNDEFKKPDPVSVTILNNSDYSKLNNKGYVDLETKIKYNTAIIGKVSRIQPTPRQPYDYRDQSTIYKEHEDAYIDKVDTDIIEPDGYKSMKIKTRTNYEPHIGDKFSTKSAQKGTVGLILNAEDMPITKNGIVPDLIVNPNSIYGRKTMSFMLETIYSKYGALSGKKVDGTPFMKMNNKELFDEIKRLGYDEYGREEMYNGMTGEKIQSLIYIGPLYYLRLKHIVCEKIYAHPSGLKTTLTRQPYAGRRNNGGARISTMEHDQIVTNGANKFLKEKFVDTSDKYEMKICDNCGFIAERVKDSNSTIRSGNYDVYKCRHCGNMTNISSVELPYASKLLFQELISGSIKTSLNVKDNIYIDENEKVDEEIEENNDDGEDEEMEDIDELDDDYDYEEMEDDEN